MRNWIYKENNKCKVSWWSWTLVLGSQSFVVLDVVCSSEGSKQSSDEDKRLVITYFNWFRLGLNGIEIRIELRFGLHWLSEENKQISTRWQFLRLVRRFKKTWFGKGNALGHGNVTSEPHIVLLLQCHLQLFSYLQVCSGLKTSVVQHFRPPKSSKMSHPSSSIHEVERRVGVLLLSLNT
jgi:hypothetical protein